MPITTCNPAKPRQLVLARWQCPGFKMMLPYTTNASFANSTGNARQHVYSHEPRTVTSCWELRSRQRPRSRSQPRNAHHAAEITEQRSQGLVSNADQPASRSETCTAAANSRAVRSAPLVFMVMSATLCSMDPHHVNTFAQQTRKQYLQATGNTVLHHKLLDRCTQRLA